MCVRVCERGKSALSPSFVRSFVRSVVVFALQILSVRLSVYGAERDSESSSDGRDRLVRAREQHTEKTLNVDLGPSRHCPWLAFRLRITWLFNSLLGRNESYLVISNLQSFE